MGKCHVKYDILFTKLIRHSIFSHIGLCFVLKQIMPFWNTMHGVLSCFKTEQSHIQGDEKRSISFVKSMS